MGNAESLSTERGNEREALADILTGDLDFHGSNGSYASHSLHAFAAKFPPQLPRVFIERLTEQGDTVLDPMMGSGTAVLEAALLGRRAIGFDIDPLAVRLCRVKTTHLAADTVLKAARSVVARAVLLLMDSQALGSEIKNRFDSPTVEFLDYWFLPGTQRELMALVMAIDEEQDAAIQDFLRLIFSSVIITKSGGVSRARDLAHSRPHRVMSKVPRNAIEQFELKSRKAITALDKLAAVTSVIETHQGDARDLPLPDSSVDLVITSPPYANAIDYMRAHKFSLVWFGESVESLSKLRATYVGSENSQTLPGDVLPAGPSGAIRDVAARDARKARVLRKYLLDMKLVLGEISRVLRPGSAAGIVVGPSTMRGVRVATERHLAEIADQLGFCVIGISRRKIDRDKRMMPARNDRGQMNGIEQRIHQESVIGLIKK